MTKARSRSQKLKVKRGRPRRVEVIRTEDGRISRSQEARRSEEVLAVEVATWKRRQINPELTVEEARKPEHGSVIAAWLSDWQRIAKRHPDANHPNVFTQLHYDTALKFHELHAQWLGAIAAQRVRSSSEFGGPGGTDSSDPFERGRAARQKSIERSFKDARTTVMEAGPLCMMALEAIVIENQPVETLRGDLRLALNRLSVLWKMQARAA